MTLTEPLYADAPSNSNGAAYVPGALAPSLTEQSAPEETTKQMVRRLAAHCQNYRGAVLHRALWQMASTLMPLALMVVAMFALADSAYWAVLLLAIPAGGLMVRVFIIQHDCGHGSFFKSRELNDNVGRAMSILTLAPYGLWRREHAQHHASSGNLDRRGSGDIDTLTVAEYQALSPLQKLRYRFYRHPLFLFGFGVPAYFLIVQRTPWLHALPARDCFKSVIGLNIAMALVYGPLFYAFGFAKVLSVFVPMVVVASATGGWLFFIQHQFEDTVWEKTNGWDFQVAALLGSSFYDLPKVLNWFTGNIGLHHIHHLNSMIPNYRLQDCIADSAELRSINRLTLRESLKCAGLKLWDENRGRMISFKELEGANS